jgi:hypothetical protein
LKISTLSSQKSFFFLFLPSSAADDVSLTTQPPSQLPVGVSKKLYLVSYTAGMLKMEDDLTFSGKWKTTYIFFKWKTTSIVLKMEDDLNLV